MGQAFTGKGIPDLARKMGALIILKYCALLLEFVYLHIYNQAAPQNKCYKRAVIEEYEERFIP